MSEKLEKVVGEAVAEVEAPKASESISPDQALNILVQAIKVATKRGAYEIEETETILKAIKVFIK